MRAYAGKIIPGDTDIVISSKTQFYFHDMSSAMASTKFEGAEIPMVCTGAEMAGAYKKLSSEHGAAINRLMADDDSLQVGKVFFPQAKKVGGGSSRPEVAAFAERKMAKCRKRSVATVGGDAVDKENKEQSKKKKKKKKAPAAAGGGGGGGGASDDDDA